MLGDCVSLRLSAALAGPVGGQRDTCGCNIPLCTHNNARAPARTDERGPERRNQRGAARTPALAVHAPALPSLAAAPSPAAPWARSTRPDVLAEAVAEGRVAPTPDDARERLFPPSPSHHGRQDDAPRRLGLGRRGQRLCGAQVRWSRGETPSVREPIISRRLTRFSPLPLPQSLASEVRPPHNNASVAMKGAQTPDNAHRGSTFERRPSAGGSPGTRNFVLLGLVRGRRSFRLRRDGHQPCHQPCQWRGRYVCTI